MYSSRVLHAEFLLPWMAKAWHSSVQSSWVKNKRIPHSKCIILYFPHSSVGQYLLQKSAPLLWLLFISYWSSLPEVKQLNLSDNVQVLVSHFWGWAKHKVLHIYNTGCLSLTGQKFWGINLKSIPTSSGTIAPLMPMTCSYKFTLCLSVPRGVPLAAWQPASCCQ